MKLFLDGPVGTLEAIFEPASEPAGMAALVCHPHPVHGGTMHNRVVVRIARAFSAIGADVLRFNFRGAGASQGSYDSGVGERLDAVSALEFLKAECPNVPLFVGGFSFGSWVGFRAALQEPRVKGLLGVGIPVRHFDFDFLQSNQLPKWMIQGEDDEFGSIIKVKELIESCSEPKGFSCVAGSDHFFTDEYIEDLSRELTQAVAWLKDRID